MHGFLFAAIMTFGLSGEAFAAPVEKTELRYQGWAGQVVFPELAEDLGYLAPLRLKWVGNTISGPQDIQTVATGDIDVGGAFYGAIIKLISAKAPIRAVIGYYGSDDNTWQGYFVKEDSPIKSARDLIGKKVAVNTLGAHLEFVLREYLARGGLSAEEVKQVTLVVVPPVTGEQALRQGQVEVTTLAGVLRDKALERGGIRKLFSDQDLFGNFTGGAYVLREKFIKENPEAARKLVEGVAKAIEWARTSPPKQRVAIARSLAYDPQVLLMDEPFAALDAQTRETLQIELLRIWRNTGKTIVFITHGIDEAIVLGQRVAVMTARPGRIKHVFDISRRAPQRDRRCALPPSIRADAT